MKTDPSNEQKIPENVAAETAAKKKPLSLTEILEAEGEDEVQCCPGCLSDPANR